MVYPRQRLEERADPQQNDEQHQTHDERSELGDAADRVLYYRPGQGGAKRHTGEERRETVGQTLREQK